MKFFLLFFVKFIEYDEMFLNFLEEVERFCSLLFYLNGWSRRGKFVSSIKFYWSVKFNFRLKVSLVINWNRKIKCCF